MKKQLALMAALLSALVITACGGGGGDDAPVTAVAASDVVLTVTPATGLAVAQAVNDEVFTFSTVPALGTINTTTVAIKSPDGSTATPTFVITETGNGTASGDLLFGSCIFKITTSTFPAGHPLALGQTVTVSPCQVNVDTRGAPTDQQSERGARLQLAAAASQTLQVTVNVTASGVVTVNGEGNVGNVTVSFVSGTSGP